METEPEGGTRDLVRVLGGKKTVVDTTSISKKE